MKGFTKQVHRCWTPYYVSGIPLYLLNFDDFRPRLLQYQHGSGDVRLMMSLDLSVKGWKPNCAIRPVSLTLSCNMAVDHIFDDLTPAETEVVESIYLWRNGSKLFVNYCTIMKSSPVSSSYWHNSTCWLGAFYSYHLLKCSNWKLERLWVQYLHSLCPFFALTIWDPEALQNWNWAKKGLVLWV